MLLLLLLSILLYTESHCIAVTPFYPSATRQYKLCTSYLDRKSSCTSPILPTVNIHDLPILVRPRKLALYISLTWCHQRQCLPCKTYASVQFHMSLNIGPIQSICIALVVVLDLAILSLVLVLDLAILSLVLVLDLAILSVVVVLGTPTSCNCVFLAFPCVLLQHMSWFRIHFHNFLSTYPIRPNDSNPYSHWLGKNAHYMHESLLALVSALHDSAETPYLRHRTSSTDPIAPRRSNHSCILEGTPSSCNSGLPSFPRIPLNPSRKLCSVFRHHTFLSTFQTVPICNIHGCTFSSRIARCKGEF